MCEEFTYIKKVAINTKKGGRFELSQQAMAWLAKKAPTVAAHSWTSYTLYRTHPALIECILTLGKKASTANSAISCVDIKKGIRYMILKDSGAESVVIPSEIKWQRMWDW